MSPIKKGILIGVCLGIILPLIITLLKFAWNAPILGTLLRISALPIALGTVGGFFGYLHTVKDDDECYDWPEDPAEW